MNKVKWVKTSVHFLAEAVNTTFYTQTRRWDEIITEVTNTQIFVLGTKVLCFEGWDWSPQDFETETLKTISFGYEMNTRAYWVYIIDQHKVVESVKVTIVDTELLETGRWWWSWIFQAYKYRWFWRFGGRQCLTCNCWWS